MKKLNKYNSCVLHYQRQKKVNGFTTMELAVVMLMSGIIASLAYGGYSIFSRQLYTHAKNTAETLNTQQFISLLKKDVYACNVMRHNETALECMYTNHTITYSFENSDYILRKQALVTDTFRLTIHEPGFLFMGIPANGVVDELHFSADYKDMEITPVFKKKYSTKQYMEFEINGH